jgi:chemotaxis protein CheX
MTITGAQTQIDRSTWLPLLELATKEVFELMLNVQVEKAPPAESHADFTAMVGLAGHLCGIISLKCSSHTAGVMAAKMLGIPQEQADEERWDASAEVCNMIAGNFKSKLSGMGNHCMLSVPTVITGEDYQTHSMTDGESIESSMEFEGNSILVSLELHS